ncbi:diacylglycerol kinase family protein [Desulforamulus putei]|uniref:Diacylglycerol kinase (ATP) n=1 Tax=Desulforamulus putei DSM 12395 TaxID=1121429 RepID=A0A1M5C1T6_9FIRM|nr:diacylglycerol kinase family protein [Desulforamulus putei]SHF48412.1 diacylglycerol kinase (ATP) [Desulforamulus putei DSM 12395]
MKGFIRSFGYALAGILYAFRTQRNMKVHFAAAISVVTVGLFLRLSPSEWVDVIFAIIFVLAAECINTAVEAAVDVSSPHKHPLAKAAKDCAAGAVLLAAINSLLVAYFILWPKILKVFL